MKTLQKTVYCSRCGDLLSPDEMLQQDEPICAFCENIRAEAMQIREHALRNSKRNAIANLSIVNTSSENPTVQNYASLP